MLPEIESEGRIVVCDDDETTRELLCENLAADRWEPLGAANAEEALLALRYKAPDLLLLDLGLPDASGLEVLREVRRDDRAAAPIDSELPVIILSGHGDDQQRVRGLREGASDFLVKPFHYPELLERIRIAAARRAAPRGGIVRVGPIRIDPARRRVTVDGREVDLCNKEYELLRYLAAEPTRVFTKRETLEDVWGYGHATRTRTLDSHASRLRRKLDPGSHRFVINAWGVGYRLIDA